MDNRIEINGVWYVREDSIDDPIDYLESEEIETIDFLHCLWESDNWVFDAYVHLKDNAQTLTDHYSDPDLTITDKTSSDRTNWVEHTADNPRWMNGVLQNDPESMKEADEIFHGDGLKQFKKFLRHLKQKGWLI